MTHGVKLILIYAYHVRENSITLIFNAFPSTVYSTLSATYGLS